MEENEVEGFNTTSSQDVFTIFPQGSYAAALDSHRSTNPTELHMQDI